MTTITAAVAATAPTALIADDEPLLRAALVRSLAAAWPALRVVAQARNGREAVAQFEALRPAVCFLDVHMPGLSGVDAARQIGRLAQGGWRSTQLVFVTAYDQYAVQAFAQGALDYLIKPVEPERLAETVARLQERLAAASATRPLAEVQALLDQLEQRLASPVAAVARPRWLRAMVGSALRLIPVDDIDFLRSDEKYTLVAWRGDGGKPAEALIRSPLKELLTQLDGAQFVQVHRSVVVNLASVQQVTRGPNETADIHLKGRGEVLPVSRSYLHLFKPT